MGNFYVNYTLAGVTQKTVADALRDRSCVVTPSERNSVVVFDEASDDQELPTISQFAAKLSGDLHCSVLAVLNHDDDILWYQLFSNGELADEYDSTPGYFDSSAEPSAPAGGDAQTLSSAFGSTNVAEVERVLRKSSFGEDAYTFAVERHAELAAALGISGFGVGTAFASFEMNELPEGLTIDQVIRIS